MCAKRLINLGGVQKVFYREDYRLHDSLELLEAAGIVVWRLPAPTYEPGPGVRMLDTDTGTFKMWDGKEWVTDPALFPKPYVEQPE